MWMYIAGGSEPHHSDSLLDVLGITGLTTGFNGSNNGDGCVLSHYAQFRAVRRWEGYEREWGSWSGSVSN